MWLVTWIANTDALRNTNPKGRLFRDQRGSGVNQPSRLGDLRYATTSNRNQVSDIRFFPLFEASIYYKTNSTGIV